MPGLLFLRGQKQQSPSVQPAESSELLPCGSTHFQLGAGDPCPLQVLTAGIAITAVPSRSSTERPRVSEPRRSPVPPTALRSKGASSFPVQIARAPRPDKACPPPNQG